MAEARTIVIEQRGGAQYLVGEWPRMAIIAPEVMPQLAYNYHRDLDLKKGDDFEIILQNARARYRFWALTSRGNLHCELMRSEKTPDIDE